MAKEIVVTIHGVNPDRGWQPAVAEVLRPHFDPIAHSYHDYDRIFGPVRAVSNIWLLLLSVVALVVSAVASVLGQCSIAVVAAGAFAFAFPLGLFLGWLHRVASTRRLVKHIANKVETGSPHVIAHSLGTYLVGRVIRKDVSCTFANVLLISPVLPRDFGWAEIVRSRPRSVRNVRNEFGTSDWVVKAVGRIRWLARDLGTAGDGGFLDEPEFVHTLPNALEPCPGCATHKVRVHNAPLHEYGHSDVFLGRRHARELWLPFLWGFPADELNQYLEDLRTAAEALRNGHWIDAQDIIDRLFGARFTWTRGQSLSEFVASMVRSRVGLGIALPAGLSVDQIVSEAKLLLPIVTADALVEAVRPNPDERIACALHPLTAIARVIEHVVDPPQIDCR